MEFDSIEELLENGKIKFRIWKRLTVDQRLRILDDVLDEVFGIDILDEIAPQLRVDDLPENYRNIQIAYVSENRLQPRSRESIEISREIVSTELQKIHDEIRSLKEKREDEREDKLLKFIENSDRRNERAFQLMDIFSRERTSGYFGWGLEPGYRYRMFYEDENYKVFEDYNYKENVIRYVIEPIEILQNPEGYFHALRHIITESMAFREMIQRMRPTINLETLDEHGKSSQPL